jgi:hypothetical protein
MVPAQNDPSDPPVSFSYVVGTWFTENVLVNGTPCATARIRIIISEQVANVRYFSLEVPFPPFIAFYKNVTENIYRQDN